MVRSVIISMIFLGVVLLILPFGNAQDQGEIEDTQVIIEKDKPLTLPKANRLYKPTEISINQFQPGNVEYTFSTIDFQPDEFQPVLGSKFYKGEAETNQSDNFVRLGFGNYQSPLVEGNYTMRVDKHYVNAYFFHESYAKGPVRDKESAFAANQIRLKGHMDGDFHVDPFINWSRDSYYFFGKDPGDLNPLMINDKVFLQTIAVGSEVRQGIESKLDYSFTPSYRNTVNKITSSDRIALETELSLDGGVSYGLVDNFDIGLDMRVATTKYESVFLQRRNFFSVNPKLQYTFDKGSIEAGLALASANDTTAQSSSLYVFPDIDFNFSLSSDLTLYAQAGGGLQMNTLYSLANENRYLDDALTLLNQANKVDLKGGIKTSILKQLVLEASLAYSSIQNLPFFIHAPLDSSRFRVIYDSSSIVRTTLGVDVGYFSGEKLSINYSMKFFGYTLDTLSTPWYKPSSTMNVLVSSKVAENLKLDLNLLFMTGIKAPSPTDMSVVNLSSIFDLGVGLSYDINDQFSAFGYTRNLVGGNYQRYLNYPARGISFKLGVLFRF
ncbi:MAG: hypothetical protein ACFHWX_10235 [Bacteroidota bacterium]